MTLESLSPNARRLAALGIAIALLLGAVALVLVPVATAMSNSLSEVEDARFRLTRLEAIVQGPAPPAGEPIPPALYLAASTWQQAAEQLASRVTQAAQRNQIEVGTLGAARPAEGHERILDLPLAVRGPQEQLLSFIRELETGQPQIRLSGWNLTPDDASPTGVTATVTLRLSGTASAVWEPGA